MKVIIETNDKEEIRLLSEFLDKMIKPKTENPKIEVEKTPFKDSLYTDGIVPHVYDIVELLTINSASFDAVNGARAVVASMSESYIFLKWQGTIGTQLRKNQTDGNYKASSFKLVYRD